MFHKTFAMKRYYFIVSSELPGSSVAAFFPVKASSCVIALKKAISLAMAMCIDLDYYSVHECSDSQRIKMSSYE